MGCASSSDSGSPAEKTLNARIDAAIEEAHEEARKIDKVLLLGAGESGKSTLFKQMRVIYGEGFSEASRKAFRSVLHANIVAAIQMLLASESVLAQSKVPGISIVDTAAQLAATQVAAWEPAHFLDMKNAEQIEALWKDTGIKTRYANRHFYVLSDSAGYFLSKVKVICKDDYIPSLDDVFRARVQTQGIVEDTFHIQVSENSDKKDIISMFDVGGQRSERRHWLHCFENVTALLYVAALSEYDMALLEDTSTNRMQESLNLFEDICESRWFAKSSIILFLNKRDLFEDKITKVPLTVCFGQYQGGVGDAEAGMTFIKDQFTSRNHQGKNIVVHFTTATDTQLVKTIFEAVKVFFLSTVLADSGLEF
eukprot:gb/GEZN01010768.1/.p1 GENE.gb/GEZN01010768.1/~~gb/GEZN01010768.1/.p1  ORF type:complete len:367 (-),score=51.88 gb/GEZN01010768.1/:19-1119(-)